MRKGLYIFLGGLIIGSIITTYSNFGINNYFPSSSLEKNKRESQFRELTYYDENDSELPEKTKFKMIDWDIKNDRMILEGDDNNAYELYYNLEESKGSLRKLKTKKSLEKFIKTNQ